MIDWPFQSRVLKERPDQCRTTLVAGYETLLLHTIEVVFLAELRMELDMKTTLLIWFSVLWLLFCGDAAAQFSQPPPDRSAPVCSEKKSTRSECKDLPLPAYVSVSCQYFETGGELSLHGMNCTASAWNIVMGEWRMIDPDLLKYYWASVVDGQEYYSAPMDSASAVVFCGISRQGYVRVSAAGGTAVTAFACDGAGYSEPGGQ